MGSEVAVRQRLVAWDPKTGAPTVTSALMLTKGQVADAIVAAVSTPYEDPLGLEPMFAGWTALEVMLYKLAQNAARDGDTSNIKEVLDRILGKSKQTSESKSLVLTYEDLLQERARELQGRTVVDVSAPLPERQPRESDPFL